jgi:hypothetical protein
MDLSDPEAIDRLSYNLQWHDALDIVEESDEAKTLLRVSADLFDLVEVFKDQPAGCEMYTYRTMQRVLADQCHIQTDADGGKAL